MAVSLVSTGVQFPDATIQTTAATASPTIGAVSAGSMVIVTNQNIQNTGTPTTIAFNGYNEYKTVSTGTLMPTPQRSAGDNMEMLSKPIYSSYYGMWFVAGVFLDGANRYPVYFTSVNGVNWNVNSVLVASKFGITEGYLTACGIAVNTSGVIQMLFYSSGSVGYYIAASADGGTTWTASAASQNTFTSQPGYYVNISIGTSFYIAGRNNGGDDIVVVFSSDGTTKVGATIIGPARALSQGFDWAPTSLGFYICTANSTNPLIYYSISAQTFSGLSTNPGSWNAEIVSISSTHLLIGRGSETTLYYTSNIDTATVTWSTLNISSIQAGSSVVPRWFKWTGSAWVIALYSQSNNTSFGGSAVYYNTSANPGSGTWTKMTLNSVGGGSWFKPAAQEYSNTLLNGVGVRTA